MVMGLIMIVMTLGIPRLVQHNETPLGGSISAVMDACASARSKAILSGKPMKMIVDASNYSVQWEREPSAKGRVGEFW